MKQRGFTLIEMVFAIAFVAVFVIMITGVVNGAKQGNTISWGINGMTEMRCIDGYKFTVSQEGNVLQVMDEFGKGLKCQ